MKTQGVKTEGVARAERAVVRAALRLVNSEAAADFDTLRVVAYRLEEARRRAKKCL